MTPIVDVVIGLGFIYLLFSLVISTINEIIARWSKRRAVILWQSIAQLFQSRNFRNAFYFHPLIRSLGDGKYLPSYIPATTFALTVIDLTVELRPATRERAGETSIRQEFTANPGQEQEVKETLPAPTRVLLETLIGNTGGSAAGAQLGLENWFTEGTNRIIGVYKRHTYIYTLLLAVAVTLLFNIDTLQIANRLYYDSGLRTATASQAKDFVDASTGKGSPDFPSTIRQLRIPIGWSGVQGNDFYWKAYLATHPIARFFGYLLSALALSLGAPFWFDTLNKFVNLRQAGNKPGDRNLTNIITSRST